MGDNIIKGQPQGAAPTVRYLNYGAIVACLSESVKQKTQGRGDFLDPYRVSAYDPRTLAKGGRTCLRGTLKMSRLCVVWAIRHTVEK